MRAPALCGLCQLPVGPHPRPGCVLHHAPLLDQAFPEDPRNQTQFFDLLTSCVLPSSPPPLSPPCPWPDCTTSVSSVSLFPPCGPASYLSVSGLTFSLLLTVTSSPTFEFLLEKQRPQTSEDMVKYFCHDHYFCACLAWILGCDSSV